MSSGPRQETAEIRQMLTSISEQQKKVEEALVTLEHNYQEKTKEIKLIYDLIKQVSESDLSLSEGIQEILDLIPPLWQYPDETCARVKVRELELKTTNFIVESSWKYSADIVVHGETVGKFEIFYNEARPDGYQGILIWEDQQLVEATALGIGLFVELEESRSRINNLNDDLEIARRAAKEYESQFYSYAARIKALKSRGDGAQHSLKVAIRNIGSGVYVPVKKINDISKELAASLEVGGDAGPAHQIRSLSSDLVRLAGNIAEYINLQTGYFKQSREPFSLRGAIESVVSQATEKARSKGIEIITFIDSLIPDSVQGDERRLRQIIDNLIREALLVSRSGEVIVRAEIEVWAHLLPIFHFSISSSERVISESQKGRMFDLFNQDDDNLETSDLDIAYGMAVAKNLVELIGGEMWIESPVYLADDGTPGSTIHFTLWMDIQKSQENRQWGPTSIEDKGLTALVVDDKASNRMMLRSVLDNWGWRTVLVTSGKEAIDSLVKSMGTKELYDAVLLDAELPDMSGFEVVRQTRGQGDHKLNSVVLMSHEDNPVGIESLRDHGIQAILRKPIRQQELYDIIVQIEDQKKEDGKLDKFMDKIEESSDSEPSNGAVYVSVTNRILFASRDRLIQLLYKGILEKRGYTISFAESPEEIIGKLQTGQFGAVLIDLAGANKKLIDTIQVIRSRDENTGQHTLLIGIMTNEVPGRCEKFIEAGLDDCIITGNGYDSLYDAIEAHIREFNGDEDMPEIEPDRVEVAFDAEKALAAVEGDYDLMYEIIDAFEDESGKYINELKRGLDSKNIDDIENVIGALSCISRKFGVDEIIVTGDEILAAVTRGDYDNARGKVELLSEQIASLDRQLSRFEQDSIH